MQNDAKALCVTGVLLEVMTNDSMHTKQQSQTEQLLPVGLPIIVYGLRCMLPAHKCRVVQNTAVVMQSLGACLQKATHETDFPGCCATGTGGTAAQE